jgi:hypothetical protein
MLKFCFSNVSSLGIPGYTKFPSRGGIEGFKLSNTTFQDNTKAFGCYEDHAGVSCKTISPQDLDDTRINIIVAKKYDIAQLTLENVDAKSTNQLICFGSILMILAGLHYLKSKYARR